MCVYKITTAVTLIPRTAPLVSAPHRHNSCRQRKDSMFQSRVIGFI